MEFEEHRLQSCERREWIGTENLSGALIKNRDALIIAKLGIHHD